MKSVFMVAEKPSLAQSLAEILSSRKSMSRKGEYDAECVDGFILLHYYYLILLFYLITTLVFSIP